MKLFTTILTSLLSLWAQSAHGWPFELHYNDVCTLRARSVWRTPNLDSCWVLTNVMGPSFISVQGSVGDGLDWDKDYEICLYDKKPDCFHDKFINCFPVGDLNCTRLNAGTHVVRFRMIPTNHTNALVSQGGDGQV